MDDAQNEPIRKEVAQAVTNLPRLSAAQELALDWRARLAVARPRRKAQKVPGRATGRGCGPKTARPLRLPSRG